MIVLFTDFGTDDIYVAQVKAVLLQIAPAGTAIIDLLHSVPDFDPRAGAHLLAALHPQFPPGTVFLAVVDPGVGGSRGAALLEADGRWFVGPDNGLLSVVGTRAARRRTWHIAWRPENMSTSFHGRDLFAPVAAHIAAGELSADRLVECAELDVSFGPGDLAEIIYVDHYGNALTGLRSQGVPHSACVEAGGRRIAWAPVFSAAPQGSAFWHENSIGLVEIAVSRGRAATQLGLGIGAPVRLIAA
jgi:S-adenosyl-L-methionine hydrolase (adenosine-forming)